MSAHNPAHPPGEECRRCDLHRIADARYRKSAKGAASSRRYEKTEAALLRYRRYIRRIRNEADQRKLDDLLDGRSPSGPTDS